LNLHEISDVRHHLETHTIEQLVSGPKPFEVETAIEKQISYKSSDIDLIPAELIQAGSGILRSEIHKLTSSIWSKEELLQQQKV
jgi:hypothetical protein